MNSFSGLLQFETPWSLKVILTSIPQAENRYVIALPLRSMLIQSQICHRSPGILEEFHISDLNISYCNGRKTGAGLEQIIHETAGHPPHTRSPRAESRWLDHKRHRQSIIVTTGAISAHHCLDVCEGFSSGDMGQRNETVEPQSAPVAVGTLLIPALPVEAISAGTSLHMQLFTALNTNALLC